MALNNDSSNTSTMKCINTYLNFNGNCEEAFNFYRTVFGGEFSSKMRFSEMPSETPGMSLSEADKNRIMHIGLPLGKNNVLMGCDQPEAHEAASGTNFHLSIDTDTKSEADKVFKALSAGGKVTMPLDNTFWGSYFGMLTDKFGIRWMVSYDDAAASPRP